ncbi:YfiT family bacillithiol transferase [Christiangramia flava]|uniref:DinB-like domain-containing protein n=1 Tax=Christiangramia flava JLT2011 TaxID=1229726 RepID=A0A1L7I233_9FLAO|nr:putative metal-dependent hydrolase [Christiangramia flava]APU67243.1 hypothetical protein GRFL_0519 [Christiangramia flava JLT2011]OSS39828.1 hypothetical protein C723_0945 [Christiangramia flava JLT2011]
MEEQELEKLKFPVGKFEWPANFNAEEHVAAWQKDIEDFPLSLISAVDDFSEQQFDTPYRPDGWSVRQLIHHISDSHLNAFLRFRWTLTEDTPTIKTYDQDKFSGLADYQMPVGSSLDLILALHKKWVYLLKHMEEADLQKEFHHPETGKNVSLLTCLGMYAWHSRHHLAHIQNLKKRKGW